jgi:hypothetical protein
MLLQEQQERLKEHSVWAKQQRRERSERFRLIGEALQALLSSSRQTSVLAPTRFPETVRWLTPGCAVQASIP